jgi:hypothetical protein
MVNLYVGNLPVAATEAAVMRHFNAFRSCIREMQLSGPAVKWTFTPDFLWPSFACINRYRSIEEALKVFKNFPFFYFVMQICGTVNRQMQEYCDNLDGLPFLSFAV